MLLRNILSKPGAFFVLRRKDCWKQQMSILLSNNLRSHKERSIKMFLLRDLEGIDLKVINATFFWYAGKHT